jgi:hypothetical protein
VAVRLDDGVEGERRADGGPQGTEAHAGVHAIVDFQEAAEAAASARARAAG